MVGGSEVRIHCRTGIGTVSGMGLVDNAAALQNCFRLDKSDTTTYTLFPSG